MKICVTGKPSSGKSSVVNYLKTLEYNVFNSDEYVHQIYENGKIGYELIKSQFGPDFVNDKEVDRKKLGRLVFSDYEQLNKLNKIINPILKTKIGQLDHEKDWFIELGTYIYYYEYFANTFDKIVLITRKLENLDTATKTKFEFLFNHLSPFSKSDAKIDIIIENNSDLKSLFSKVQKYAKSLRLK